MFVKHCKVEVYLLELNLCENDNMDNVVTRHFSKADTIGENDVDSVWLWNQPDNCSYIMWKALWVLFHQKCLELKNTSISKQKTKWSKPCSSSVCRYDREGDEKTVQYSTREGNAALEQIHEQHLRAVEQARQHCAGRRSLPGAGSEELDVYLLPSILDGLFLFSLEHNNPESMCTHFAKTFT